MENSKFQIEGGSLKLSNAKDSNRQFDIRTIVYFDETGNVSRFDEGEASRDGASEATFNTYEGQTSLNATFHGAASEQPAVLAAINEFIEGAKAFAASKISI